ncbi:hypothetical protein CEW92_05390 [Bacillaceae bacterium SAS-127]|nr:hypothetical protein CEW92_05390 [Bacillaceae bacterium SAS-127]
MIPILSVTFAILYAILASISVKFIIYSFKKKLSYELGFFVSSIFLGGFSFLFLRLDTPYFMLNSFLKAGVAISMVQLFLLPVLIILKRARKNIYMKVINRIDHII